MIETGETKEEAALRELREETGFSGSVLPDNNMRLLPVCSGTGSESTCLIPVIVRTQLICNYQIDLDAPNNETARQQLDEDELISTEFVPWESFPEAIDSAFDGEE